MSAHPLGRRGSSAGRVTELGAWGSRGLWEQGRASPEGGPVRPLNSLEMTKQLDAVPTKHSRAAPVCASAVTATRELGCSIFVAWTLPCVRGDRGDRGAGHSVPACQRQRSRVLPPHGPAAAPADAASCAVFQDFFFYSLVYDPQQKTLLADKGEIRVGNRYQADITDLLKEGRALGRERGSRVLPLGSS